MQTLIGNELWLTIKDGDHRARALYKRHYSSRVYADNRNPALFVGPGEKMVLITPDCKALLVWRKFIDKSKQTGINCAIFRNETTELSSTLLKATMELAFLRWPNERLYTYVNPLRIRSTNPGWCFQMAGWEHCGATKSGLVILEYVPKMA